MSTPLARRGAGLALSALLALTLSSCTSSSKPSPRPAPTMSAPAPSHTTSPSPVAQPKLPVSSKVGKVGTALAFSTASGKFTDSELIGLLAVAPTVLTSDGFIKASKGHHFMAVEVSITNTGAQELIETILGARLSGTRKATPKVMTKVASRVIPDEIGQGPTLGTPTIQPHETVKGWIVFNVPNDFHASTLIFTPGISRGKPGSWALN